MSVGSISFWQQDQNFLAQNQQQSQTQAASAALISAMGSAVTSRTQGLSSLANQTALNRTNTALTAAIQAELQQTQSASSSSTGSAGSSSSGSSTSTAPTVATPATGTGTVPLTAGTLLMTLGIPPNNAITVSDGTNTTTFASTATDTVGDLINAINDTTNAKNAAASAYLNGSGNLVITATNTTDSINVGGLFAQNVGFGPNNQSFSPVTPAAGTSSSSTASPAGTSSSSSSSSATSASSSSGSSTSSSSGTSSSTAASAYSGLFNSSLALQTGATAEFLLAANGSSGTTLDLLA
jgi:hypothetical protein